MITEKLCPLARTFGVKDLQAKCMGEECALYRTLPPSASEPSFKAAIQREMACLAQEDGKGKPAKNFHNKAVNNVMKSPEKYGVKQERRGYCGLGGRP
ncbi:hypothetical protein [Ruegeria lacuscaerulensis]|uniref:hypothetical protein n=1 Tax=Ruegeria lacuscaerulensis TaxID=55218 RepID=UPI00147E1F5D|nr:hypothetical protein [Ruegeria lacuscaerulensis]